MTGSKAALPDSDLVRVAFAFLQTFKILNQPIIPQNPVMDCVKVFFEDVHYKPLPRQRRIGFKARSCTVSGIMARPFEKSEA